MTLLARTLLCAACCALTLAIRTPPRVLQARALAPEVTGYPAQNAEPKPRHIGIAKAQVLVRQTNPNTTVEVTTYAPRPTTSMPQSKLRALCVEPRGKFPHPLDCRKYLDCWDGRVLEKRCPNDLVFSDLPGAFCDYLEYVDCGTRPVLSDDLTAQVLAPASLPIAVPDVVPSQPPAPRPTPPPPAPFIKWAAASNGALPTNAVVAGGLISGGGTDQSMYVGRALVDGNVLPCTLVPRAPIQGCYVAWNNEENLYSQYEVLQSNAATWVPMTATSNIPANAIPTGLLDVTPIQRMYTGRAVIGNLLVPGYISDGNKLLVQTKDGITYFATTYEILVQK